MLRRHKKVSKIYNVNTFPALPKTRYQIIKSFDLCSDFHHDLTKYLQALIKSFCCTWIKRNLPKSKKIKRLLLDAHCTTNEKLETPFKSLFSIIATITITTSQQYFGIKITFMALPLFGKQYLLQKKLIMFSMTSYKIGGFMIRKYSWHANKNWI